MGKVRAWCTSFDKDSISSAESRIHVTGLLDTYHERLVQVCSRSLHLLLFLQSFNSALEYGFSNKRTRDVLIRKHPSQLRKVCACNKKFRSQPDRPERRYTADPADLRLQEAVCQVDACLSPARNRWPWSPSFSLLGTDMKKTCYLLRLTYLLSPIASFGCRHMSGSVPGRGESRMQKN